MRRALHLLMGVAYVTTALAGTLALVLQFYAESAALLAFACVARLEIHEEWGWR